MDLRAAIRTVLVTALAIGLIAFFLRNADLSRVWIEITAARPFFLALALVLTMVTYLVRAERWLYLLQPLGHPSFNAAFRMTVIGFAASYILPARAGEVIRPYLLARRERLDPTAAFATIVVERLLDLAAVLVLLGAFFIFGSAAAAAAAPELFRAVEIGAAIMLPLGLAAVVVMFVLAGHPERLHALVLRLERVLPLRLAHALAGFARALAQGFAVVRQPRRLMWSLMWSLVLWVAIAAQVWVGARAFSIVLPPLGSCLITAMLVVGVALPTPGGVGGVHEAFRLGATAFFGANNDAAVGAAIVLHASAFVPITLLGLWFATRDGLTFGRLRGLAGVAEREAVEGERVPS